MSPSELGDDGAYADFLLGSGQIQIQGKGKASLLRFHRRFACGVRFARDEEKTVGGSVSLERG